MKAHGQALGLTARGPKHRINGWGHVMQDLLGYIASALVAVSMFFSSSHVLRIVNSFGAVLFIVYGAWLPSIPVIITNVVILGVNLWHLFIKPVLDKKHSREQA